MRPSQDMSEATSGGMVAPMTGLDAMSKAVRPKRSAPPTRTGPLRWMAVLIGRPPATADRYPSSRTLP